jgi:hypothetical protein
VGRFFLFDKKKREGGEKMKKRISLLFAALMLASTMSFGGVAFAKIQPVGPWIPRARTMAVIKRADSSPRARAAVRPRTRRTRTRQAKRQQGKIE